MDDWVWKCFDVKLEEHDTKKKTRRRRRSKGVKMDVCKTAGDYNWCQWLILRAIQQTKEDQTWVNCCGKVWRTDTETMASRTRGQMKNKSKSTEKWDRLELTWMSDFESNKADNAWLNGNRWSNFWWTDTEKMESRTRWSKGVKMGVCRKGWEIMTDINARLWGQNRINGGPNVRVFAIQSLMDRIPRRRDGHGSRKERWSESAETGDKLGLI